MHSPPITPRQRKTQNNARQGSGASASPMAEAYGSFPAAPATDSAAVAASARADGR